MYCPAHQVTVISAAGQTLAIPALQGLAVELRFTSFSDADSAMADTDLTLLVEPPLEWLETRPSTEHHQSAETILVARSPSKSLLTKAINQLQVGGVALGLEDEKLRTLVQQRLAQTQVRKQQLMIAGDVGNGQ